MTGDIKDYITYRLSRAETTFQDAKMLADNESWNSCVNRLYYSCFYAVTAILISKGYEAKTHNGVKTIFFKEFIATGQIDKEFGNLYSDLIAWRSEGDYADFVDYDSETVLPMIEKVEAFLKLIIKSITT
jgi:uncharacterized protein